MSIPLAFVVAAVILAAGIPTVRRWRLDAVTGLDLRPATPTAPTVMLEPGLDDGSVLVTVSYRVQPPATPSSSR